MVLILETATNIMGNKERACRLPMMQYMAERMSGLCYERPWYAKMGGCTALKFLYQHMAMRWLYQHLFVFLKAFMFVIMDLAGEVSSGAIDMAKTYLEQMLTICMVPLDKECRNEELIATQNKAIYEVVHELVRQVTSSNTMVREQAMASIRLIANLQNKTITEVMDPHREVLADIIPPRRHLLRHQPACAQIGLMDGNTFCTTLEPRLFTIDLANNYHKLFFHELLTMSEAEDSILNKLDCYKNVNNLIPLRKSALRALSACHYINDHSCREKILLILLKSLEKNNAELQEAAFECLQKFLSGFSFEKEGVDAENGTSNTSIVEEQPGVKPSFSRLVGQVHSHMRPLLLTLGDYRNLTLNGVKRLSYLTQLFPSMFNEKLLDQLLQHVCKMLEISIQSNRGKNFLANAKSGDTEQKLTTILHIFHTVPTSTSKFIGTMVRVVLQAERSLMIEPSCPFREPLVKSLLKFPEDTIDLLMNDTNIKDQQYNRFAIYLLKHKDGALFREYVQNMSDRLVQLILCLQFDSGILVQSPLGMSSYEERYEAQHQAILVVETLIEFDCDWLSSQGNIVAALKQIWQNDLYKTCETNVSCDIWHMVAKIFLHYFTRNTEDFDLLFMMLKALCLRFIPDFQVNIVLSIDDASFNGRGEVETYMTYSIVFCLLPFFFVPTQFLRDFLANTVAHTYSVEWKRKVFFHFVQNYNNPTISQELKAKVRCMI